jgi:hypothetical protein
MAHWRRKRMWKGSGRVGLMLAFLSLGSVAVAVPSSAQILAIGGQVSANTDAQEDVTWGVGPRVHLGLPLIRISVQGTYDFYAPDCGTLECDLKEMGVNVLWSLPVPFLVSPYLGAGLAFQKWEGESYADDDSDTGVNFLAGIVLQGPMFQRFQPFGEVRYQIWKDYGNQKVFAAGILMNIF